MTRILVTGFDAFDGLSANPSWEAARRVAEEEFAAGADIVAERLPVSFEDAPRRLAELVEKHRPGVVINIGVAMGRPSLCVERVAINCMNAGIPDNSGRQPVDEEAVPGGPAAYFSTFPLRQIVDAWEAEGLPGRISNTAGTYVCNRIMYDVLHHASDYGVRRAGFLHVPLTREASGPDDLPVMDQRDIDRGVRLAVREVVRSLESTSD